MSKLLFPMQWRVRSKLNRPLLYSIIRVIHNTLQTKQLSLHELLHIYRPKMFPLNKTSTQRLDTATVFLSIIVTHSKRSPVCFDPELIPVSSELPVGKFILTILVVTISVLLPNSAWLVRVRSLYVRLKSIRVFTSFAPEVQVPFCNIFVIYERRNYCHA